MFNLKLLNLFKDNNKQLYLVGGAVRDYLMNIPCHDYDYATDATPNEMIAMDCKTVETGKDHGTITFIIDGNHYEVTTFRKDFNTDGRHADVQFSKTIEEDLSRRDFTINAIAMDINNNFIDPFNGINDIKNKIIKAVNNPQDRIEEDYLRMLRAVRFATKLNFKIEQSLYTAIHANCHFVTRLSRERINDEIMKSIKSKTFDKFLKLLLEIDLLVFIMPDVDKLNTIEQNEYHDMNAFNHTLEVIRKCHLNTDNPLIILGALFHDIGKIKTQSVVDNKIHFYKHDAIGKEITIFIMESLKFSNNEIKFVSGLVNNHMYIKSWGDNPEVKDKAIRKLRSIDNYEELLILIDADNKSHAPEHSMWNQVNNIRNRISSLKDEPDKLSLPVNGKDLMLVFRLPQSQYIGKLLNIVKEKVFENPSITKQEIYDILRPDIKKEQVLKQHMDLKSHPCRLNMKFKKSYTNLLIKHFRLINRIISQSEYNSLNHKASLNMTHDAVSLLVSMECRNSLQKDQKPENIQRLDIYLNLFHQYLLTKKFEKFYVRNKKTKSHEFAYIINDEWKFKK